MEAIPTTLTTLVFTLEMVVLEAGLVPVQATIPAETLAIITNPQPAVALGVAVRLLG
jgi:hypothetical protein